VRNLEIGAQFPDSKNAQRNLEIAQIPKLRGTYIHSFVTMVISLDYKLHSVVGSHLAVP